MRWILFGAVGALAFVVHFGVAVAVVEWGHGAPGVGNVVGYLCALGTSWLGQSRLTFTDAPRQGWAPLRFVATSVCGFVLNAAAYAALLRYTSLDYRVALALVMTAVAVLTWLLFRHWVFPGARAGYA